MVMPSIQAHALHASGTYLPSMGKPSIQAHALHASGTYLPSMGKPSIQAHALHASGKIRTKSVKFIIFNHNMFFVHLNAMQYH